MTTSDESNKSNESNESEQLSNICPMLNQPCITDSCTQWTKLNVLTVNKLGVPMPEERSMCMTSALLQCLMSVQGAIQVLGARLGAGQQQQPMISFKAPGQPRKN